MSRRKPSSAGSRFIVSRRGDHIELWWNDEDEPDGTWRVLRSEEGFADHPLAPGHVVVVEGETTHVSDRVAARKQRYFYSLFLRDRHGAWSRRNTAKIVFKLRPRWWPDWRSEAFIAIAPLIRRPHDRGCVEVVSLQDEEGPADRCPR